MPKTLSLLVIKSQKPVPAKKILKIRKQRMRFLENKLLKMRVDFEQQKA
jgi:hypothetical protein